MGGDALHHLGLGFLFPSFTYLYLDLRLFLTFAFPPASGGSEQAGGGCLVGSQGQPTTQGHTGKLLIAIEESSSLNPLEKRSVLSALAIVSPKGEGFRSLGVIQLRQGELASS